MKVGSTAFLLVALGAGGVFASAELGKEMNPRDAWEAAVERDGHLRYRVKVVSDIEVPKDVEEYEMERLRLSHAVPTPRPWSVGEAEEVGLDAPEGASDISFSPESGVVEYSEEFDSHQVVWELTKGLEVRAKFAFETEFTVVSCERRFNTRKVETSWEAYKNAVVELPEMEKKEEVPEVMVGFAEATRKRWAPHEAVLEFCKWIDQEMEYDVRVDHDSVASVLDKQRGYNVHYVALLGAMCRVAGIPMRQVNGLKLTQEDGVDEDLIGIRPELANLHSWAEVYFPEYGWIEVDPSRAPDFYEIPVNYVQNNRLFQTQGIQVIAVAPGGAQVELPLYRWERGGWVYYFVKKNTISFESKRHRVAAKSGKEADAEAGTAMNLPEALLGEREWTDVQGRKMRAAVVGFADEAKRTLIFRRGDGRQFEFPVEGLSEKDRGFLLNALDGG